MEGSLTVGHWEPIVMQVWDTVITPCDCCGQVVAKQLWIVDIDGEPHRFCSERCEELFRTHVMPQRGAGAAA
jgi:ribosomal protein L24E